MTIMDVRTKLIHIAFNEIYHNGYQGTGLNQILEKAELTKGALYHYFKSKKELALHAISEILNKYIEFYWEKPLENSENPVDGLIDRIEKMPNSVTLDDFEFQIKYGCPLNNFIQEMAPIDKDFSELLKEIYLRWGNSIDHALERGIEKGFLQQDIESSRVAFFITAAIEGCILNGKIFNSSENLVEGLRQLVNYINSLRV